MHAPPLERYASVVPTRPASSSAFALPFHKLSRHCARLGLDCAGYGNWILAASYSGRWLLSGGPGNECRTSDPSKGRRNKPHYAQMQYCPSSRGVSGLAPVARLQGKAQQTACKTLRITVQSQIALMDAREEATSLAVVYKTQRAAYSTHRAIGHGALAAVSTHTSSSVT